MIKRDTYLQQIIRNMWNGEIKVITGIRRCGKSVLLFNLFKDYLLSQNIPEDNIIKIELKISLGGYDELKRRKRRRGVSYQKD